MERKLILCEEASNQLNIDHYPYLKREQHFRESINGPQISHPQSLISGMTSMVSFHSQTVTEWFHKIEDFLKEPKYNKMINFLSLLR